MSKSLIILLVFFSVFMNLACTKEQNTVMPEIIEEVKEEVILPVQHDTQAKLVPAFDITSRPEGPPIDDYDSYLAWMKLNTNHEERYLFRRWERAEGARKQFVRRGAKPDLHDPRIIAAFLRTPREFFARNPDPVIAYTPRWQPIGYGQTISGPYIVSRMTSAIDPQPHHKVLEIGTGSGYQAAFLAELTNFVYTIEIVKGLYEETKKIYESLYDTHPHYRNIKLKHADGYFGWEEYAPFDRIIVTAGIDHIPPPLLQQLSNGGIMVIPVGPPNQQKILKITKIQEPDGTIRIEREDIYEGTGLTGDSFVPFVSREGGPRHSEKNMPQTNQ